jgi:hypothetical protein
MVSELLLGILQESPQCNYIICVNEIQALDVKGPNREFPALAISPHKLNHYQALDFEMNGILKFLFFLPESQTFLANGIINHPVKSIPDGILGSNLMADVSLLP